MLVRCWKGQKIGLGGKKKKRSGWERIHGELTGIVLPVGTRLEEEAVAFSMGASVFFQIPVSF